jgi:hypothetical protein
MALRYGPADTSITPLLRKVVTMNSKLLAACTAASLSVLGGCAVVPTVELRKITQPADLVGDELDTYFFQRSLIVLDKGGKDGPAVTVASVPYEYMAFKLGLRHADSFGVRTNLNVTKRPNTDLIQDVGVEVIDTRVDTIAKIGSIAAQAVKLVPFELHAPKPSASALSLPATLDAQALLEANAVTRGSKHVDVPGDGSVAIDFGPLPPDAEEVGKLQFPFTAKGLVYAACRSATVTIPFEKGTPVVRTVKVSDARYYQRVSFPVKGKVTFHSECGVSLSSDKDAGVSSNADVVAAVGKAVSDALDASKGK